MTGFSSRDFYHYPIAVQAGPGRELELRVQYDTEVFDGGNHRSADGAVQEGVGGDDGPSGSPRVIPGSPVEDRVPGRVGAQGGIGSAGRTARCPHPKSVRPTAPIAPPATLVEQILASIYAEVLGVDRGRTWRSRSSMRAAIRFRRCVPSPRSTGPSTSNSRCSRWFDAPSVRSLAQQLANAPGSIERLPRRP